MAEKHGSGGHKKTGGELQGQKARGQVAQDDRRQESGRRGGGEPPMQDKAPGKRSHLEREKAEKGKGSPA